MVSLWDFFWDEFCVSTSPEGGASARPMVGPGWQGAVSGGHDNEPGVGLAPVAGVSQSTLVRLAGRGTPDQKQAVVVNGPLTH